jgi:small subunit ribosomal protein S4
MGDPKRITNKYSRPAHPWNKARLEQEKPLMKKYGLEAKNELWKITSKLKTYKQNAKRLVALKGAQAEKEKHQIFSKLNSYGLVHSTNVDDILGLNPEQLLDRRLQTIVFKKGLARTIKQARQMITHKHVIVNGKKITSPSYLVKVSEEHSVEFYAGSNFSREDHPERPVREQVPGKSTTNVEEKVETKESKESKPKKKTAAPRKKKEEKPESTTEEKTEENTEDNTPEKEAEESVTELEENEAVDATDADLVEESESSSENAAEIADEEEEK